MNEKRVEQQEEVKELLALVMKMYGLSDKGVLRAISYADGIRDGGESQKTGA